MFLDVQKKIWIILTYVFENTEENVRAYLFRFHYHMIPYKPNIIEN